MKAEQAFEKFDLAVCELKAALGVGEEVTTKVSKKGSKDWSELKGAALKDYARDLGLNVAGTDEAIKKRIAKKLESAEPAVEEIEKDEIYEQVITETEAMDDEEIADLLKENGIRVKGGKRQSLIDAVVKAVREGVIMLTDEEPEPEPVEKKPAKKPAAKVSAPAEKRSVKSKAKDEEPEPEPEEKPRKLVAKKKPLITADFDVEEFANGIDGSARHGVVSDMMAEADKQYKKTEIGRDECIAFIEEYWPVTDVVWDNYTNDDLLTAYKIVMCLYVDDDGEVREKEDPYTINDVAFCCGHQLKAKGGRLSCLVCGGKYETEDE